MKLNLNDPTPLYRQIADDIKKKISNGELREGDRLASHQKLAASYDVSMITIKKALSDLINQDILFGRVGKGTFVARKKSHRKPLNKKTIGFVLRDIHNPYFSLIAELGFDYTNHKDFEDGRLFKVTIAPQLSPLNKILSRPALRAYFTYAHWSESFMGSIASISFPDQQNGISIGIQMEVWW